MSLNDIEKRLDQIPEIRALQTVAQESGLRFSLRGGVVRNLLFRARRWREREMSLYEFVDAFSDIDVLVEEAAHWPELAHRIGQALPFAGFFNWDAETRRAAIDSAESYESFPADNFVLNFAPENRRPTISGFQIDAVDAWRSYEQKQASALIPRDLPRETRALAYLKASRYDLQFRNEEVNFPTPAESAFEFSVWPGDKFDPRIRLAVFDILFNVPSIEDFREVIEGMTLPGFDFGSRPENGWFAAAYYRTSAGSSSELEQIAPARMFPEVLEPYQQICPWLPIQQRLSARDSCCEYRDFSTGPTTLAWRNIDDQHTNTEHQYSAAAVSLTSGNEDRSAYSLPRTDLSGLPSYIQGQHSVVARVDLGYLDAIAGPPVDAHIAIFRSRESL